MFSRGGSSVRMEFSGSIENFKKKLKSDRDEIYSVLMASCKTFYPTEDSIFYHFRIFNILSIPSRNHRDYILKCRESIRFLFKFFSDKTVLVVRESTLKTEKKNLFDGCTEGELFREFATGIPELHSYQPRLSAAARNKACKISGALVPDFSKEEEEQKSNESGQQQANELYTHADVYEEFLVRHADLPTLSLLIRVMLCFSTNSAGPERMFSLQNRIKTKARNRLSDLTLNDEMHIVANNVPQMEMDFMRAAKMISEPLPPVL